jgi:hypothetical protein
MASLDREKGIRAAKPDIAGGGQVEAAAETHPVNRGEDGFRAAADLGNRGLIFANDFVESPIAGGFAGTGRKLGNEPHCFVQIETRAENPSLGPNQDHRDGFVVAELLEGGSELAEKLRVEGVQARGIIEHDLGHGRVTVNTKQWG